MPCPSCHRSDKDPIRRKYWHNPQLRVSARRGGRGGGASGGEAERTEKSPGPRAGAPVGEEGGSEYEGIIRKVLGRQLLCARHDFEWINLIRRGGNTGLRA